MASSPTATGYSIDNARKFGWAAIGGPLSTSKLEVLDKYVVGPKLLDAGCGAGGYVDYFARKGLDATGIDKFPMFLNVAKDAGFKGTFIQGSLADRLPFADAAFDTTVCLDVLEHVDDLFAISELARVTRKRLIITVPQDDQWMSPFQLVFSTYRDQTHLRYYTDESLKMLAESVGPQRVTIFGEQLVSIRVVALKMLEPSSRYPMLSSVYKRLFRFLLYHCPGSPAIHEPCGRTGFRSDGRARYGVGRGVMRVGMDVQVVADGNRSGLYNHLRWLTHHIRPLFEGELYLLANLPRGRPARATALDASAALDGAPVTLLSPPARFYRVWHRLSRVNRLDVLMHNLHGYLPMCTHGVNAFVVPDVIPLGFDYGIPGFADQYRPYYETAVQKGDVVIVSSEHARRDLLTRVGGSEERVRVIPLAAGPEYRPASDTEALDRALASLGLTGTPYVLCVATLEARKNHAVLLRAFAQMVATDPALPHRLVLVGGKWVGHEAVFKLIDDLRLNDRIVLAGFTESLPLIYAGADAFVFPSLYEGFGLPPLEAMACGTPVLAADASSLPEVVGDAGILFDPHDSTALADHLTRVLADRVYRDDLIARGLARATNFSWEQTAASYLDAFIAAQKARAGGTI